MYVFMVCTYIHTCTYMCVHASLLYCTVPTYAQQKVTSETKMDGKEKREKEELERNLK